MGVPKFFRYMSERYPCLSELVKDYQIPDFDNLYLDMNGIIHVCSHPNDFDPLFRISEEKIFASIFHYIEILFNMIKPRKLFYMAVDGVAPRAKMNQQRGRRFRSAKEAEMLEKRALEKGEKLPDVPRFDSNCITPGTVFMERLNEQLKYFVANKISNDPLWQGCKIILSGHETPGEGEHKIMDYIRYMKTLPEYDSNTRHCLYGLDADLIMLGLCTHEPHFSLLREEVKYGKQNNKRITSPEETKFYLLHLSLMREYLDLEFQALKTTLPFEYNLENIIDDWVLMGFLVGNDFIPHLPDLHINKGALPILYKAYIEVLPTLTGYLNENGFLNLPRFQSYMERLGQFDMDTFEETYADIKFFEEKTGRKFNSDDHEKDEEETSPKSDLNELIKATNDMFLDSDDSTDEFDGDTFLEEFSQHKRAYYRSKLEYEKITDEVMKSQAEGYIRALQWNLHYYYHGCKSWSWYYPHHYSPYISDIINFKDLKLDFDLGKPFLPFEQLLAVLPAASKNLLPEAYQELMTSQNSPIIDFYPPNFETDLNGKQQDWEAVVLIPFIDEEKLLKAMQSCNEKLTEEEKRRNKHGPMFVFTYTDEDLGIYRAPEYFPAIVANHAFLKEVWREEINVEISDLCFGLRPGVLLDVYFPGFPTLKHIPYTGSLKKAKVKVFEHASKGENMILKIIHKEEIPTAEEIADKYLGKEIYVNWPHMVEARCVSVSDGLIRYNLIKDDRGVESVEKINLDTSKQAQWNSAASLIQGHYYEKLGIDLGETEILIYAYPMEGRKYVFGAEKKISYEKIWSRALQHYALQATVKDISVHAPEMKMYNTIQDAFPVGSIVFMLGHPCFGSKGIVADSADTLEKGRLRVAIEHVYDPKIEDSFWEQIPRLKYMPGGTASQRVGISPHMLSRITGCIFVDMSDKERPANDNAAKMNIGLNLKFNKKNEEVPGYTKKDNNQWTYSPKAVELVSEYVEKYPHVIEYLSNNVKNDYFFREDIFPDPGGVEEVKKMMSWLKEQDYNSIERTECGTEMLDSNTVSALEKLIDEFEPQISVKNMQIKPHLLYKSDLLFGHLPPMPGATHRLLDRVVNVRSAYTVPVGLRGFIIGIHKGTIPADYQYDILFDKPFTGGMTINSSPHRAYRTSFLSFINISHGERFSQSKPNTSNSVSFKPRQAANFSLRTPNRERATSAFAQWNNIPPKPTEEEKKDNKFEELWLTMQAPKPKDQTNVLKQILKIETKPKTEEKPKIEEPVKSFFENLSKKSELLTPEKEEEINPVKAFFASAAQTQPSQPSKKYYSQLFTFFQKKNFGQPRFNFLEVGGNKFMAQIRLPDGSTYCGLPCDSKESACESAALQVLGCLGEIQLNNEALLMKDKQQKLMDNQNKLEKGLKAKPEPKDLEELKIKKSDKSDSKKPSAERTTTTRSFFNKNYQRQNNIQSLPTPPLQWFGHRTPAGFPQASNQSFQHPFYKGLPRNDHPFMISDGYVKNEQIFLPPWVANDQMPTLLRRNEPSQNRNRQNEQSRYNAESIDHHRSQVRRNDQYYERNRQGNDNRHQNDSHKFNYKNDNGNQKRNYNDALNNRQKNDDDHYGQVEKNNSVEQAHTSGATLSGTTEFVPLQAITKTRVRGAIPVSSVKQTQDVVKDANNAPVEQTSSAMNQQANSTAAKPKRKPRLAANFGQAWDPNLC